MLNELLNILRVCKKKNNSIIIKTKKALAGLSLEGYRFSRQCTVVAYRHRRNIQVIYCDISEKG